MSQSDDKILEEYLEGNSDISRRYSEENQVTVPDHLDSAILSAAKLKLSTKNKFSLSSYSSSWQVPLSIAAVMLLSVSLVVTMYDEYGQSYLETPSTKPSSIESPIEILQEEEVMEMEIEVEGRAVQSVEDNDLYNEVGDNKETSKKRDEPARDKSAPYESIDVDDQAADFEMDGVNQPKLEAPAAVSVPEPAVVEELVEEQVPVQRVDQLQREVEELKKTQSTLANENEELQDEIGALESKQVQIKEKLNVAEPNKNTESTIDLRLRQILELWDMDKKTEAFEQLQQLRKEFPDISLQDLHIHLPDELINLL